MSFNYGSCALLAFGSTYFSGKKGYRRGGSAQQIEKSALYLSSTADTTSMTSPPTKSIAEMTSIPLNGTTAASVTLTTTVADTVSAHNITTENATLACTIQALTTIISTKKIGEGIRSSTADTTAMTSPSTKSIASMASIPLNGTVSVTLTTTAAHTTSAQNITKTTVAADVTTIKITNEKKSTLAYTTAAPTTTIGTPASTTTIGVGLSSGMPDT
jgi:hypothetical protein